MTPSRLLAFAILVPACSGDGSNGGGCPALTRPHSGGTMHSYPEQSEADGTVQVWKAEDSPHLVGTYDLGDIELTIEPCAYVLMDGGSEILVSRSGKLIANGTADRPIVIDALDPSEPWQSITTSYQTANGEAEDHEGGSIEMSYVTLANGGVTTTGSLVPMLSASGDDPNVDNKPPTEHLDLQHVTIRDGSSYGIVLALGATFSPSSTDVTITGQPFAPLQIGFRNIDAVPPGSYDGAIEVDPDINGLFRDAIVHDRGVPYVLGDEGSPSRYTVGLDTGAAATLTIEPGVTMQFRPRTVLEVATTGTLIAKGTAAKPITFTSNEPAPAPGAWTGIQFLATPTAASGLDHVVISYAGDDYQASGLACSLDDQGARDSYSALGFAQRPASALVTNTTISHSMHDGIARAWAGAPLDLGVTNTFDDIAGCKQSYPVPDTNVCPVPVPCD